MNVFFFTSNRSEYGLLRPLIKALNDTSGFNIKLLVGGSHLLRSYGNTIDRIIDDGFEIAATFPFLFNDSQLDVLPRSLGVLSAQIGHFFSSNKVDLLFVLGDRLELIPVVSSAMIMSIPIAHISGGETTEGAIDNQIRHAITKMSHLHYPATEYYKENLLSMGEEVWRICVSGEPGLDQIISMDFILKEDLYEDIGLCLDKPVILCTFHPETINNQISPEFVSNLLSTILDDTNYQLLVTASNFDHGGPEINEQLDILSNKHQRISFIQNLGQRRYYSLLRYADLMLGNSSSGLVEAQSFELPAVNVGKRQKGRMANPNVLDCKCNVDESLKAISAIKQEGFRDRYKNQQNIYGDGKASSRIIQHIKDIDWKLLLTKKDNFGTR